MAESFEKETARGQLSLPSWFGWTAMAAGALLPFSRLDFPGHPFSGFLLTPGEWLLLPLGVLAPTMGLLRGEGKNRGVIPAWTAAIAPALLWLLAMLLGLFKNGPGRFGLDLLFVWTVRLAFPPLAFLPLLTNRRWRDRLFLALTAGALANVFAASWQMYAAREGVLGAGVRGFLDSPDAYGLLLAVFLPVLADWRGGRRGSQNIVLVILCTFLLPALALMSILSGGLLLAAFSGLFAAWAMWRGYAWILGVFVCLLVFGYGGEAERRRDRDRREALARAADLVTPVGAPSFMAAEYDRAFDAFVLKPFFGEGAEAFHATEPGSADARNAGVPSPPWYAALLGGSGIAGLGMWLALLAELLARAAGRGGAPPFAAGALGGTVALLAAGIWTDVLVPGVGAFAGLLLALSVSGGESEPAALGRPRVPRVRTSPSGDLPDNGGSPGRTRKKTATDPLFDQDWAKSDSRSRLSTPHGAAGRVFRQSPKPKPVVPGADAEGEPPS